MGDFALPSQEVFETIITSLYNPSNVERKEAESYYDKLMLHPAWLCRAHLAVMRASIKEDTRYMCGILLRRILSPESKVLNNVSQPDREAILSDLIDFFRMPGLPKNVRRGVTLCLACMIQRNDDPGDMSDPEVEARVVEKRLECIPFLLQILAEGDAAMRNSSLLVLKNIAPSIVGPFLKSPHVDNFCAAMLHCLKDNDLKLRASAIAAITQFIIMEDERIEKFEPFSSEFLVTLQQALTDSDIAQEVFENLIQICENNVSFFSMKISDYVRLMFHIANTSNLDKALHCYCVEFLLSFCESKPKAARNLAGFPRNFFELCMNLCMHPPECDDDWATSYEEKEDDNDDIEIYDVGLEGLDRLACALKAKCIGPIAQEFIIRYAKSPRWEERQAACSCIGQVAEGCHEGLKEHLVHIVGLLEHAATDDHPRVRYTAISSLAQIMTDFGTDMEEYYGKVIPIIVARLQDPVPRIQAIVAASICNFSASADREHVETYANPLLQGIYTLLLNTQYIFVKQQCLSAIAGIAENCGEMFATFYSTLTPIFQSILQQPAQAPQVSKLQCQALDALSLMAVAVGKGVFVNDAPGVCNYLMEQQNIQRGTDDEFMRYVVRAWGNMAKCLQVDFAPYMNAALQPLLYIIAQDIQITILDDDEEDDKGKDDGTQVIALSIRDVGQKRMKVNTSLIGDIALAMGVLAIILEHVEVAILTHLDEIINRITPLIGFKYVEDIRIHASRCAWFCLHAVCQMKEKATGDPKEQQNLQVRAQNIVAHFLGPFHDQLRKETEVAAANELLNTLCQMIKKLPNDFIPQNIMEHITETIIQVFKESTKRRLDLYKQIEDEEEEDAEELLVEHEDEEELLADVVEFISVLLKTHQNFLPIFLKDLLPAFSVLLDENAGHVEHRTVLCLLDDFLEHKEIAALPFFDKITAALLKYAVSEDWQVVQCCSYGLGLVFETMRRHPQHFQQSILEEAGKTFYQNFQRKQSDDDDETYYLSAMANVIRSSMKLLRIFPKETNEKEHVLLQQIVEHLPVREDETEARIVHRELIEMINAGHPFLCAHKERIRTAIGQCVSTDLLDDETKALFHNQGF